MNLTMLPDMAAESFGERTVIGTIEEGLSVHELRGAARGGAALARSSRAESVVYLAANGSAFAVALFSAAMANAPFVPANHRLGDEQLRTLPDNHPHALVIADRAHAGRLIAPTLVGVHTPESWLEATNAVISLDGQRAVEVTESTAVIIYMSGTATVPETVVLRHDNQLSYVLGPVEFGSARPDEAALMRVPAFHIADVSNVLTNLCAGRQLVAIDSFTPDRWLEVSRAERITNATVVPHVGFVNAYGLTETPSTTSILGPDDHREALQPSHPRDHARWRPAGRPIRGIEIEIRHEDGTLKPSGDSGRVWDRGQQVSDEYAGRAFGVVDGWFDTRDPGRIDEFGYLYVEGRADDTIIRGAENISPADIEDVLLRQPDVADAVVIGFSDDEWGERIEAVVVPVGGVRLDPEALRAEVRRVLRSSKTPDRIVTWDEIPRTVTGKTLRHQLRSELEP